MHRDSRIKRFEIALTRILENVVAVCFLAILMIVIALVVLRYVFNSSITGANETITVLFVYTTAIGAAVAVGRREHIAITVAVESSWVAMRKILDAAGLLLITLVNGVMFVYAIDWIGATGGFLMPSTGLPRAVAQISIPLGSGLAILYCAIQFLLVVTGEQKLGRLWMHDDSPDDKADDA